MFLSKHVLAPVGGTIDCHIYHVTAILHPTQLAEESRKAGRSFL